MYLKMYLLVCAFHLFTTAWSIGLTESRINQFVTFFDLYKGLKNQIPIIMAMQYLLESGCTDFTKAFQSGETVLNNKTLPDFLIFLSGINKSSDNWMEKGLTSYEVKLFLTMFDIQDKKSEPDGLLNYVELVQLLDNDIHLEPNVEKEIKNTLKNKDAINALMFLAAILKHKPEGKGLDKTQIEKCAELYMPNDSQLNYSLLQAFIKNLNIVSDAHLELMDFKNEQPAAYELQEFLVFWSEYNKEIDGNFFTSKDIRNFVLEFNGSKTLANHDGVLDLKEFAEVSKTYIPNEDTSDYRKMTFAMFVNMKYILYFEQNKISPNEKVSTEITNEMANKNVVLEETNAVGNENVTSD